MRKIITLFLMKTALLLSGCDAGFLGSSSVNKLVDDVAYDYLYNTINKDELESEVVLDRYAFLKQGESDIYHAAYTAEVAYKNRVRYLLLYIQSAVDDSLTNAVLLPNKKTFLLSKNPISPDDPDYLAYTEKALKEKLGL